ncbi:MAG: hypothetical protein HQL26_00930 [Candidatus Omnitrophica bacterium]|nr:hypothetical protein [Candidatus Omnitrophota bacterium]
MDIPEGIYKTHGELFDAAHHLDQYSHQVLEKFNQKTIVLFDLRPCQRIFLFILTRSLKTYTSILYLCEKGYGQDASPLLRSLLENLITAQYILHNPAISNDLAKRFVAYKWVILKRQLSDQEQHTERTKIILEKAEEFKKTFKVKSDRALLTWSGKTVRDMAKQIDKKWLYEYETIFRLCSRFSHPSILGDNEYMILDEKKLVFSSLPSDIGIVPNLPNAAKYCLEFLMIINDLFKFNCEKDITAHSQELEKILHLPKYHNGFADTQPADLKGPSIRDCIVTFQTQIN